MPGENLRIGMEPAKPNPLRVTGSCIGERCVLIVFLATPNFLHLFGTKTLIFIRVFSSDALHWKCFLYHSVDMA